MEKKTVLENLDLVLLSVDEIIDGGWVPSALHNILQCMRLYVASVHAVLAQAVLVVMADWCCCWQGMPWVDGRRLVGLLFLALALGGSA